MKLAIFPLGNFGDKYKKTRHNAGRIVCKELESTFNNYKMSVVNGNMPEIEIIIPDTYMNESGSFIVKYMKNKSDSLMPVIIYDDKDLLWGEVKLSYGNSSGGHNGVQSVIDAMGLHFYRIRIGIGEQSIMTIHGAGVVQDYVMSNLEDREVKILKSKSLQDLVLQALLKVVPK